MIMPTMTTLKGKHFTTAFVLGDQKPNVKFAMYTQCCVAYGHTAGVSHSEKRLFLGNLQNWRQISHNPQ
jgi:hypothetical protein